MASQKPLAGWLAGWLAGSVNRVDCVSQRQNSLSCSTSFVSLARGAPLTRADRSDPSGSLDPALFARIARSMPRRCPVTQAMIDRRQTRLHLVAIGVNELLRYEAKARWRVRAAATFHAANAEEIPLLALFSTFFSQLSLPLSPSTVLTSRLRAVLRLATLSVRGTRISKLCERCRMLQRSRSLFFAVGDARCTRRRYCAGINHATWRESIMRETT